MCASTGYFLSRQQRAKRLGNTVLYVNIKTFITFHSLARQPSALLKSSPPQNTNVASNVGIYCLSSNSSLSRLSASTCLIQRPLPPTRTLSRCLQSMTLSTTTTTAVLACPTSISTTRPTSPTTTRPSFLLPCPSILSTSANGSENKSGTRRSRRVDGGRMRSCGPSMPG